VHADTQVTMDWAGTSDGLSSTLGFDESETPANGTVTGSKRHLYGWYSPVGADYDLDVRRIPRRQEDTEAGGLVQYASSQEHRYRELRLGLLSPAQLEEGGTDDDGYGGTVDWTSRTLYDLWQYVRDRPFRFYADRTHGTVASPGSEGTEYVTCRRTDDEWRPGRRDPDDWAYWDITIPLKVTGE